MTGDLRYCITNAADDDSITFAVTRTINPSRALPNLATSVTIEGPGADQLTVRQNTVADFYRVFTVDSDATRSISGLSGTNRVGSAGGGISNAGTLTVSNCVVSDNGGGGISNAGTLTVSYGTISGNYGGNGGGIPKQGTLIVGKQHHLG